MADALASGVAWILQFLIKLLPDTPVTQMISGWAAGAQNLSKGLQALNWFVDINGILIMFGIWLVAVELYCIAWFAVSTLDPLKRALERLLGAFTN